MSKTMCVPINGYLSTEGMFETWFASLRSPQAEAIASGDAGDCFATAVARNDANLDSNGAKQWIN